MRVEPRHSSTYESGPAWLPLKHSSNAVVQKAEYEEQIVKTCQDDEEVIEGVLHVLARQNVNGKTVPDQAEGCHESLKIKSGKYMSTLYCIVD